MYEPLDEPAEVLSDCGPPKYIKTMQGIWLFLMLPWFPFAGLSGMAFDGGRKTAAYVFVWAVWTYPITVFFAWMLKRWRPEAIFLPLLNIVLIFFP